MNLRANDLTAVGVAQMMARVAAARCSFWSSAGDAYDMKWVIELGFWIRVFNINEELKGSACGVSVSVDVEIDV